MISPRLALAAGAAALAGATVLLVGWVPGSVVTVIALALAARAAAAAVSSGSRESARSLGRQAAVVPAWIGIAVVGTLRAGSERLADVRGANRVAGLAIARGHALLVAAAWVSVLAAVVAIAVPALGRITAARDTGARLEMLAAFAQVAVVVTLFCGPQVAGARDAVPWVAGAALLSAGVYACSRLARWDRSVHIATVLAAVGVALALSGGRL